MGKNHNNTLLPGARIIISEWKHDIRGSYLNDSNFRIYIKIKSLINKQLHHIMI